jgi:hypothetical protein
VCSSERKAGLLIINALMMTGKMALLSLASEIVWAT